MIALENKTVCVYVESVNDEINHVLMGDLCNKKMRRDEFKTKELKMQEKERAPARNEAGTAQYLAATVMQE